jgi:hypothetical protein
MKMFSLLFSLLVSVISTSYAQTDYEQWECSYVRVKPANTAMYEKGLIAHNKKFHAADPYKVHVFDVISGPNSGGYFIALGSVTWTELSGRPSGTEHDTDWDQHVQPFVDGDGETMYWRRDNELKYSAPNSDDFVHSRFRNFTVLPGQRDRFESLIKQVVAMYKTKAYPASYNVYWRQGATQGSNALVEINMNGWSFFDRLDTFEKDFEEVHGEGSFSLYLDEIELCIDRAKTFDELVVYRPELSSPN